MSLSQNYPDIRPLWMNDYANAGVIDPRCSFARSDSTPSNVHYWSSEDHLSSENLLLQSSDFDTSWSADNLSGRNSGQTDPAGGTDGFEIAESTANSWHRIYQVITATGDITAVVYAKQNSGTRYLMLTLGGGGNYLYECATFDLAGGTPNILHGSSSSFTNVSATQTASGNGYYKCVLKATGTCSSLNVSITNTTATPAGNPYGLQVYAGDGTSSIDIAFASLSTTGATDYNPTTTQIHREYAATLKSVAYSGQPRFEYEPTGDRSARGLLLEGQAQNLVSYSESFSNQTINNSTLTESAAVGPDGTLNANLLVPTSSGATGRFVNLDDGGDISHTSGDNYAFSIYAKSAGYNYLQWVGLAYFGSTYCNFDLSNGTVGNKSGSVTGRVESAGNGWYRLTVVAPATTTNNTASKGQWQIVESSTSGRATGFTGNDYSGVLMTMAQCELSSFSSSYIKSDSGSASTRTADSLSVATADIGYTGGPVSVVSETIGGQGSFPIAWVLKNSNASESLQFYKASGSATTSSNWRVYATVNGANTVATTINSSASAGKIAVSFDANDVAFTSSGNAVQTDTSTALLSGISTLSVGGSTNQEINGHVKRIALYSEALTDTELQALTS